MVTKKATQTFWVRFDSFRADSSCFRAITYTSDMMSSLDTYVSGQQPLITLQTPISDEEENMRITRGCVLISLEVLAQVVQTDLVVQE
jgi:hypothetical protein